MGNQGQVGNRLKLRLRDERERRGWSQTALAATMARRGFLMEWRTISKIENGDRAIRVHELVAYADVFDTSVDMLIGRSRGGELAWAAGNLTANAQKMAGEVSRMGTRLREECDGVRAAQTVGGSTVEDLLERAELATQALSGAFERLNRLANQFPIPT